MASQHDDSSNGPIGGVVPPTPSGDDFDLDIRFDLPSVPERFREFGIRTGEDCPGNTGCCGTGCVCLGGTNTDTCLGMTCKAACGETRSVTCMDYCIITVKRKFCDLEPIFTRGGYTCAGTCITCFNTCATCGAGGCGGGGGTNNVECG